MKLGMAQMCMADDMDVNLGHAEAFCREASAKGCDLLFFPEIQLTPFFPQYTKDHLFQIFRYLEAWFLYLLSPYLRPSFHLLSVLLADPYKASFSTVSIPHLTGITIDTGLNA